MQMIVMYDLLFNLHGKPSSWARLSYSSLAGCTAHAFDALKTRFIITHVRCGTKGAMHTMSYARYSPPSPCRHVTNIGPGAAQWTHLDARDVGFYAPPRYIPRKSRVQGMEERMHAQHRPRQLCPAAADQGNVSVMHSTRQSCAACAPCRRIAAPQTCLHPGQCILYPAYIK